MRQQRCLRRAGLVAASAVIVLLAGCREELPARSDEAHGSPPSAAAPKQVTLAIRDDWDKGHDLAEVGRDFALINELGVNVLFVNIGWDDYEPEKDRFDFEWLHQFVELAARHGIKLRPYICYKPWWEGDGGWNSPPSDYQQWRDFCAKLGEEMKRHPNVLSYEIWLEENSRMWWRGTADQYRELLESAASALRSADPDCLIALGGFTCPDDDYLRACAEGSSDQYFDVVPLHCYNETWAPEALEEYLSPRYSESFFSVLDGEAGGKPLWMSECGYSTMDRSEEDQANYIARAVSYFLADPLARNRFALFTCYELRDLPEGSQMIGDEHNYHFGLCRSDGSKKLAFRTYRLLVSLLDGRSVRAADGRVRITATSGSLGAEHHHLLQRADGAQILFVYDKENAATVQATLSDPGAACTSWRLDGTSEPWADFDGANISGIALDPGQVRIFEIR